MSKWLRLFLLVLKLSNLFLKVLRLITFYIVSLSSNTASKSIIDSKSQIVLKYLLFLKLYPDGSDSKDTLGVADYRIMPLSSDSDLGVNYR